MAETRCWAGEPRCWSGLQRYTSHKLDVGEIDALAASWKEEHSPAMLEDLADPKCKKQLVNLRDPRGRYVGFKDAPLNGPLLKAYLKVKPGDTPGLYVVCAWFLEVDHRQKG